MVAHCAAVAYNALCGLRIIVTVGAATNNPPNFSAMASPAAGIIVTNKSNFLPVDQITPNPADAHLPPLTALALNYTKDDCILSIVSPMLTNSGIEISTANGIESTIMSS
jgi:hypothetical protein